MKHANQKTPTDVIVPDGAAGMQRLEQATRHILSVPKETAHPAPKKSKKSKK